MEKRQWCIMILTKNMAGHVNGDTTDEHEDNGIYVFLCEPKLKNKGQSSFKDIEKTITFIDMVQVPK